MLRKLHLKQSPKHFQLARDMFLEELPFRNLISQRTGDRTHVLAISGGW